MERRRVSGACQKWINSRGSFHVERVGKDAIVFTPRGHMVMECVELFEMMVDECIADGRPHLFWDGGDMTGYDSDFRIRLGKYCVSVKDHVASMNVYAPQPLVAMGASVINIWLGGFFTMHKTRSSLLETLSRVKSSSRK